MTQTSESDDVLRIYADPGLLRIERRHHHSRLYVGMDRTPYADLHPHELRLLIGTLVGELCRLDARGIR